MKFIYIPAAWIWLSWLISCSEPNKTEEVSVIERPLFQLLDPENTGIDFRNDVVDGEHFNIISYRNFYNGGGVAIGDINNDSLPDIFFIANQGANKLYLNLGGFTFKDITDEAGVGGSKAWSTGVTMADVNGDGFLDIYVCNSGDIEGADKKNELFINNGDLTFSERAADYNLNNSGYSTHAAFFDYDQDGDLDCYILNNSFRDPEKIELYKKVREQENDPGGDKLMRNDQGIFKDVTREAGIYSSDIGFGLGVAIGDLNSDNLPDIYISNDFWERDYLYLNKGNGSFTEELINRIDYCSISSMGADIADINNDGSPEIFTTDMLPGDNYRLQTTMAFDPYHLEDLQYRANFHYQITQNCLHLNDGAANFQEIALLSGVAATDWSWGALIFDFDNDGNKDIFVTNGIARDLMSMDYLDFTADSEQRKKIVEQKGKFDQRDFIAYMPSNPLNNYAFVGNGQLIFKDRADSLGLGQPSFSNGSAYGDLDNDGDLDLVVNNVNQFSFVYRNNANLAPDNHFLKIEFKGYTKNPFGIGAKVIAKTDNNIIMLENYNTRGFQSSIEPSLLFGLGEIKVVNELKVVWPDGKVEVQHHIKTDQTIILNYDRAVPPKVATAPENTSSLFKQVPLPKEARHTENPYNDFDSEILLPRLLSTEGPRLVTGDVNNDQLEDFIILGATGDPDKLFIQKPDGTFRFKRSPSLAGDARFESTCGALFDQDGDGDLDLMIGSGGNEIDKIRSSYLIRFYKNDGSGNFQADATGIPQLIGNFSTVEAADFDQDGAIDVFLGARSVPGNYGLPPRSFLLRNVNGTFLDKTSPELANIGMVTDASWSDIDNDGDKDLLVVGDWMSIHIFKNENGKIDKKTTISNSQGWWNRIEAVDLDNDGDTDFVVGNWGLNTKFKASLDKPMSMYVNDYDNNGKSEFIINWYPPRDHRAYPFATKMELTTQLPGLRKRILKYEDYAPKTYDSLFSSELRASSVAYAANYLESAVLWNQGGNQFELSALPLEAQVSPVFGIIADDMDNDGHVDIWLGGNFYALKPQVGRHDASRGVFLKGSSDRNFTAVTPIKTGLYVKGEVRDAVIIGSNRILVGRNNDTALLFGKELE